MKSAQMIEVNGISIYLKKKYFPQDIFLYSLRVNAGMIEMMSFSFLCKHLAGT